LDFSHSGFFFVKKITNQGEKIAFPSATEYSIRRETAVHSAITIRIQGVLESREKNRQKMQDIFYNPAQKNLRMND